MAAERQWTPVEDEEREQQRLAIELAGLGTWSCDSTVEFAASLETERMIGLPEGRGRHTYADWEALIHPDDRAEVVARVTAAVRGDGEYASEYRVLHPTRGLRWIVSRGRRVPARGGRTSRLVGVVRDVTESRSAAAEIRRLNDKLASRVEELQTVLDVAPVAIAIAHDAECRSITLNAAGARLLGVPEGTNASKSGPSSDALPFRVLRDGRELAADELPMQEAARRGVELRDVEVELVRGSGEALGLTEYAAPLFDASGAVRGAVGVFVDITERVRMERRLRDADRRKDEFLAMLAHELRNPLAPIRNAAQYLRRIAPAGTPILGAAEVIERQALQMTRLVDDLLDVSRITRGRIELRRENVDLRAAVREAVERAQSLLDARGHRFVLDLPPEPAVVYGDPIRLTQAVDNLLTNAAKYTEPGGSVALALRVDGDTAEVVVRDDGVGIAADLLPHVFDLFVQSDRSLARSEGGLGIGLSVVKRLVQMHGGTVAAESAGPGRGSRFAIRLPLATPAAGAAAAPASTTAAGADGATAPAAAALPAAAPATRRAEADRAGEHAKRVLVVDDNPDCAESLALLLRCDGYDARARYGPHEALAEAEAFAPDAVLLDIGLPGIDGYEVARRLRAQPATAGSRLIALTGYGQAADRERALAAGFDRHVVKPVDPEALAELLGPP